MTYTYQDIAKMIDHSLLNPIMTDKELTDGCRLAVDYSVASVCIKPYFVKEAKQILNGSDVKTGTTVGFPHGGHMTEVKVAETKTALADGAQEIDMVVNIGKVLSGDWEYVSQDIRAVVEIAHKNNALVKVIFENCYLKDDEKIRLCQICGELKADFVKTSTGYATGGATIDDLKLMRRYSPSFVQVKAAGGIRTLDNALEIREIGVARFGATRTKEILDDCKRRLNMV